MRKVANAPQVALLLVVLSAFAYAQSERSAELGAGVARAYYRGAQELVVIGDRDEALRLLAVAAEFNPQDSDVLYLIARIHAERQDSTAQAIEYAQEALLASQWRDHDDLDARLLLADLYYRTRAYDAVLAVLAPVEAEPPPADVLLRRARAHRTLGRPVDARRAANRGVALYPEVHGFSVVLLRMDDAPGYRWGQWLRRHASSDPAVLEAMLYYAARQPVAQETLDILNLYFRHGGSDPLAVVLTAQAGGEDDTSRFRRLGGFADLFLVRRLYAALTTAEVREELDSFVQSYDGWITGDRDRDGYYEERALYSDGVLRRWERDADQNGIAEHTLFLDGLLPLIVQEETDAETVRISYGRYPAVESVTFVSAEGVSVHHLVPDRLRYPILDPALNRAATAPDMLVPLSTVERLLNLDSVRQFTHRRETRQSIGAPPVQIESYADGVLYSVQRDHDGDGRIDHLVEYEAGTPVSGIRDLNGDGRYEVSEQYVEGELSLLMVDADGDGTPEFRTSLGEEIGMAWDYDEDGNIDARELSAGRDRLMGVGDSRTDTEDSQ